MDTIITQHSRRYDVRPDLIRASMSTIANKSGAGWNASEIAEWFAVNVGPNVPYAAEDAVSEALAEL